MVACKTIGKYRKNQKKIKKFCLEEAKQAKQNSASVAMGSHPTTNKPQEIPGPSGMLNPPTTRAPKRPRSEIETSSQPKRRTYKKETTNTKWSKEKILKIATKKQKEQQQPKVNHPKGGKKPKSKQSTPVQSFHEKAKQAALRQSLTASTRRLQSATSDTDTNRSFLIFNTPIPQPPSKQIFNVDAEPTRNDPYEIIASNDPTDFMETSSLSPRTQGPQLIATSSLVKNNAINTNEKNGFQQVHKEK